jgi:hypothetical protein
MATEIDYWAGLSGLSPASAFSLHDHQLTAMVDLTSSTDTPSFDTVKHRYYQSVAPEALDIDLSVSDYEREYYLAEVGSGSTLSLEDLKSLFLASQ